MAGNETHGYDLVIEFAERAVQEIVGAFFDKDGFLSDLLSGIGAPDGVADAFSVVIAFDRPPGMPSSDPDIIDLRILLGEGGTGSLGHLRVVAGVNIEATTSLDVARIDLEHKLELTEVDIDGLPGPINSGLNVLFRNALRDHVKSIPLVPVPVDRATTSTTTLKSGDVRIVDDTSSADRDAVGFLLTFGGGSAGDRNAFTRSFLEGDDRGGIAIAFPWLCRVISPVIDNAMNLGGAFTNCRLTRTVRIDEDDEVDLTALTIEPAVDFIRVSASVRKSGFCYEATGTVGARIRMEVVDGSLVVSVQVDDPVVDVDIPWYCWLAGAVIGAIVAGVIGAVLVPIIIYIAQESVEGTINSVAARVADAINSINLNATIPMPVVRIVFQRVFIDDVTIACDIAVKDEVPIRSEGVVILTPGTAVDLDSGQVGRADMGGADLACTGIMFDRRLRAVCGARLARTGTRRFDSLMRSTVYGFTYSAPNPVPLLELATLNPLGFLFGDPYDETNRVYAVSTNEGRYSIVQAVRVDNETIRLRYRTWEKRLQSLQITGDFQCDSIVGTKLDDVRFVPSGLISGVKGTTGVSVGAVAGTVATVPAAEVAAGGDRPVLEDPCGGVAEVVKAMVPAEIVAEAALKKLKPTDRRIGTWNGTAIHRLRPVGRFDAVTQGVKADAPVHWSLDGNGLAEGSGDVTVPGGITVHYEVTGRRLLLTPKTDKEFEMLLAVTLVDEDGAALTTKRCIHYNPVCKTGGVRYTPSFTEFKAVYLSQFGVVEVPTPIVLL